MDLDYLESSVLDMILDNIETGRYQFVEYDEGTKWVLSEIRKKLNFSVKKRRRSGRETGNGNDSSL